MNYTALIVAAGTGSRVGLGYNKLLYKFQNGKTIIEKTVSIFQQDHRCKQIILVASEQDLDAYRALFVGLSITYAIGGETRQHSVYNGLQEVQEEYVFIHDGARPWLPKTCIDELCTKLKTHPACLLCVPAKDTIKEVKDVVVVQTLKRSTLWLAQTPQAFQTRLIVESYQKAMKQGMEATDDAQIVEVCSNIQVHVVEGSYENSKVTTIEDIQGK